MSFPLGEAVIEATLTKWLKNEGDAVTEEEPIAEIATDKVIRRSPLPVAGVLAKKLVNEGKSFPLGKSLPKWKLKGPDPAEAPAAAPAAEAASGCCNLQKSRNG